MYDRDFRAVLQYRIDMRRSRRILRAGSNSFFAASLLLPKHYRDPIIALYAFCRVTDDIVDREGARASALRALRKRLRDIYAGRPADAAVDRLFADVVATYDIPYALPAALLEGYEWDIRRRDYETLSDVYAYSARVAGTVGTMMALIMGVRDPALLSRACDLGVAMQLTNIARDVGEDARAGRLYLPRCLLGSAGLEADTWLADPRPDARIAAVTRELLDCAASLYERSEFGISALPPDCRPAIFAARYIYADIGRVIAANAYDSVSQRAVVSYARKARLLGTALRSALRARGAVAAPVLNEVRFLVDACA